MGSDPGAPGEPLEPGAVDPGQLAGLLRGHGRTEPAATGQPRPMYGIAVANTVMFATFASSGRLAM